MKLWTFFRPGCDNCIHDNDDDRSSLLWRFEPSCGPDVIMTMMMVIMTKGKVLDYETLLTFLRPRCPCCRMSIPEAPAGILGKLGIRLSFLFFCALGDGYTSCYAFGCYALRAEKSERGKHLPERKPVDPHRRLTITCTHGDEDDTWWRFLMAMVVFAMTTMMRRIVAGCWPTETSHDYALI